MIVWFFFFSSRRRHTRSLCDWSSDVCSSDLDRRECRRAGYVVVVDVRLEGVRDQHAERRRGVEIGVEVAVRIDKEGDALIRVGHQVGGVPETGVKELLEKHLSRGYARGQTTPTNPSMRGSSVPAM